MSQTITTNNAKRKPTFTKRQLRALAAKAMYDVALNRASSYLGEIQDTYGISDEQYITLARYYYGVTFDALERRLERLKSALPPEPTRPHPEAAEG